MNNTVRLLLLIGGGYLLWRYFQNNNLIGAKSVEPLPEGAQFTGKTERTTNAGAPGEEIVGYGVRDWAEIQLPSGHSGWVEVRQS